MNIQQVCLAAIAATLPSIAVADFFIDVGANVSRVEARIATIEGTVDSTETGVHFGMGVSRRVGERNEFGARVELDNLGSDLLLAVRALDYRRHFSERFAGSFFIGAARLDLATPAYGYYMGTGLHYKDLMPSWDLNVDLRYGDKIARDNLLPSDPQGGSPDNFFDVIGVSVYISRRF